MSHLGVVMLRRAVAAALVIGAAACGHMGIGSGPQEDALVVFRNQSTDQADVYAIAPGSDFVRIGTVFPGATDTLRVRNSLVAQGAGVNIVARLLARSNTPSSGVIPLHSGDMFEVSLQPDGRTMVALPATR